LSEIEDIINEYKNIDKSQVVKIIDDCEIVNLKMKKHIKELENKIFQFAVSMIKEQIEIANMYDVDHLYDNDIYLKHCKFKLSCISTDCVGIDIYERYGYDCDTDYFEYVYFDNMLKFNKNEYINQCINTKISYIKAVIETKKCEIADCEKELQKIQEIVENPELIGESNANKPN